MSDLITIDDLIKKVHHLVEYDLKTYMANDKLLKPILSLEEQINVKFFRGITDFINIKYYDEYLKLQQLYSSDQIDFYSFLYCIFNDISEEFYNSTNKNEIINKYINDFIINIKKNKIVTETPTFKYKKDIQNNLKNHILTNDLIQFISIYFNINIFVIDVEKNCVIFYTLNEHFNRFKHSIVLIKAQQMDYNSKTQIQFYKNVYYKQFLNNSFMEDNFNNTKPLLKEIFNNYPKMIIYSQLNNTPTNNILEPNKYNHNFLIVKQIDDNDLNIIDYSINKNKIQTDIKIKKKIERKHKKNKDESSITDSINNIETTENMLNDIIIMPFTQEILNSKDYKDIRQIAKSKGIRLSYVSQDGKDKGKRINKTKSELIEELLNLQNH